MSYAWPRPSSNVVSPPPREIELRKITLPFGERLLNALFCLLKSSPSYRPNWDSVRGETPLSRGFHPASHAGEKGKHPAPEILFRATVKLFQQNEYEKRVSGRATWLHAMMRVHQFCVHPRGTTWRWAPQFRPEPPVMATRPLGPDLSLPCWPLLTTGAEAPVAFTLPIQHRQASARRPDILAGGDIRTHNPLDGP